jgi:hypothetical protein
MTFAADVCAKNAGNEQGDAGHDALYEDITTSHRQLPIACLAISIRLAVTATTQISDLTLPPQAGRRDSFHRGRQALPFRHPRRHGISLVNSVYGYLYPLPLAIQPWKDGTWSAKLISGKRFSTKWQ